MDAAPLDPSDFLLVRNESRGAGRPPNEQSKQADGRSVGNREAGSLPRVGRFGVRRRGGLLDRRRGRSHFGGGRLSLVAESRGRSCFRSGTTPLLPLPGLDVAAEVIRLRPGGSVGDIESSRSP